MDGVGGANAGNSLGEYAAGILGYVKGTTTKAQFAAILAPGVEGAAGRGDEPVFTRLVEAGAQMRESYRGILYPNRTLMGAAALGGNVEIMGSMLRPGAADLGQQLNLPFGRDNITPVFQATDANMVEVVSLLLDAGADPNIGNRRGSYPLHLASGRGNCGCVKALLLTRGAAAIKVNINPRDSKGNTALYLAVKQGHIETVKALLKARANVSMTPNPMLLVTGAPEPELGTPTCLGVASRGGELDMVNGFSATVRRRLRPAIRC